MDTRSYKLIKDITPKYTKRPERVGIYLNEKGQQVVIKKSDPVNEKLETKYLKNEAKVLQLLVELRSSKRIFPQFIEKSEKKEQFYLVEKKVEGERLDLLSKEIRVQTARKAFKQLQELSLELKMHHNLGLGKKSVAYYLLSFPIQTIKVIIKDPDRLIFYLRILFLFYYNYLLGILSGVTYGLAHTDLWPDNILVNEEKNSFTLLDWESASVNDSLYDLAQVAMAYSRDFSTNELINFLKEHLETNGQRRRFISLAIFNSILMLANIKTTDKTFKNLNLFILKVLNNISPTLIYKRSPFEVVNNLTLNVIYLFYRITGIPMVDPKKKIILCYHSVGNDGWRFSTRIKTFESHLAFLKKNYHLVSLKNLLDTNNGGVNISFDDGYQNVLTNALPQFEGISGKPTMFIIGDSEKANRTELDNNLVLMTKEQILQLKKNGWEIGFHTNTHPDLADLNIDQLNKEIVQGKRQFEKRTKLKLRYFAYPKGKYSKKIIESVKKAGFEFAFTVDGKEALLNRKNNMFIDRVPIEGELTAQQLGALISPIGLIVTSIFLKMLDFKEKYLKLNYYF